MQEPKIEDSEILNEMEESGGSFLRAYARACQNADSKNFLKLKEALPEFWFAYSAVVRQKRENKFGQQMAEQAAPPTI